MSTKNPYLKRAHEQHAYTPEEILELSKCMKSPKYFMRKYCKIQHPVKGSIPFDLRPYQERMVDSFTNHRLSICLAPRQIGKCLLGETKVTVVKRSNIGYVRKAILWLFDRKTYARIFKDVRDM